MISYDDFAKLDIRIGTITSVEVVEGSDKLLRLVVDFGSETRQIVSGIRMFFEDIQMLVGRQSPFLFNLETRTIRGVESQGMILAVGDDTSFSLLHPAENVAPGSTVR